MEQAENCEKSDSRSKTRGTTGQKEAADNEKRNADHKFLDRQANAETHQQATKQHRANIGGRCQFRAASVKRRNANGDDEEEMIKAQDRMPNAGQEPVGECFHWHAAERVVCKGRNRAHGENDRGQKVSIHFFSFFQKNHNFAQIIMMRKTMMFGTCELSIT